MSTYYYFKCDGCKLIGGFFSRQALATGNFDIIESFKFLAYHTIYCPKGSVTTFIEHDVLDLKEAGYKHVSNPKNEEETHARKFFLKETEDIFPHSDDYGFMQDLKEGDSCREKWMQKELHKMKGAPNVMGLEKRK